MNWYIWYSHIWSGKLQWLPKSVSSYACTDRKAFQILSRKFQIVPEEICHIRAKCYSHPCKHSGSHSSSSPYSIFLLMLNSTYIHIPICIYNIFIYTVQLSGVRLSVFISLGLDVAGILTWRHIVPKCSGILKPANTHLGEGDLKTSWRGLEDIFSVIIIPPRRFLGDQRVFSGKVCLTILTCYTLNGWVSLGYSISMLIFKNCFKCYQSTTFIYEKI